MSTSTHIWLYSYCETTYLLRKTGSVKGGKRGKGNSSSRGVSHV